MKNSLKNKSLLLGSVALVAALAFSTQSANAQGFSHQPNRQAVQSHRSPSINHNAKQTQNFGHQTKAPKKAEPHKFAQTPSSLYHHPSPVAAPAPCHHQAAPQVVVVGQPKKPNLFERIANVFR